MNKKSIEYYLALDYPVSFQKTEDGYEAWHPDFGRYTILGAGNTLAIALKTLESARRFFIRHLVKSGLEIPEPSDSDEVFSGRFVVRVPKDLHRTLAREAERNGVSLNSYIIHLLSEKHSTNGSKPVEKVRTARRKTGATSS